MNYSKEYLNYMKSKEWKKKRKKKLKQVGCKCQAHNRGGCNGPLQVHHLHYKNLGKERLSDLQVFCQAHHREADKVRQSTEGPLFSEWEAEYLPDKDNEPLFTTEDLENIVKKTLF